MDDLQPSGSNLPYMKVEDTQYFAKLLEDVDEETLPPEEQKERKIMRLLLKIKNGTPPMRKVGRWRGGGMGGGEGGRGVGGEMGCEGGRQGGKRDGGRRGGEGKKVRCDGRRGRKGGRREGDEV